MTIERLIIIFEMYRLLKGVLTGEKLKLSGRSLHRCLRVGRTIADIDGRTEVTEGDLSEALAYRKDSDLAS